MRRRPVPPTERGASAVEFALVAPLLFGLLFGIVDYGLYFADVLSVQQGLGDAARAATLAPAGSSGPLWGGKTCGLQPAGAGSTVAGGGELEHLACSVLDTVEPAAGSVHYVRAELVAADGTATQDWSAGTQLRLCAITEHPPVLPMVPLPSGGRIETRVDMPVQAVPALVTMPSVASALPAGLDWSWC